ncbi:TPA: hypothetical protein DEO28_00900 [Candidatus Dependentiae bacterium]|nr:hypothetical protein [Candidatus Dependentiae bacterium]HBZ73058.1 hypothetical protein [Candidatus Dependentiae bacterium]
MNISKKLFFKVLFLACLFHGNLKSIKFLETLQDSIDEVFEHVVSMKNEQKYKEYGYREIIEKNLNEIIKELFKSFLEIVNAVVTDSAEVKQIIELAKCKTYKKLQTLSQRLIPILETDPFLKLSLEDEVFVLDILRKKNIDSIKVFYAPDSSQSKVNFKSYLGLILIEHFALYEDKIIPIFSFGHEIEHNLHEDCWDVFLTELIKLFMQYYEKYTIQNIDLQQCMSKISNDKIKSYLEDPIKRFMFYQQGNKYLEQFSQDDLKEKLKISTVIDSLKFIKMLIIFEVEKRADLLACFEGDMFDVVSKYFEQHSQVVSTLKYEDFFVQFRHPSDKRRAQFLQMAKEIFVRN